MSFYKITQFSCEVPAEEVLKHMGMPGTETREKREMLLEVEQELWKYKSKFLENIKPLALLSSGNIKLPERQCGNISKTELPEGQCRDSSKTGLPERQCRDSNKIEPAGREIPVAACVTTLGEKVEQWIAELFSSGEIFTAMVMDAASDVYLFHMQEELSCGLSLLCRELRAGIAGRISIPEELPMEVQKQIVDITHAEEYGITLSEAYMFSPLKTVSILYRLGAEGKFCIQHDCSRCSRTGCAGRK